jgi:TetR/AcrR family transcriptional repressor of nem operon
MAEAGLTHGGFYKSFGSKDELIAEACRRAADRSNETWRAEEEKAADPLEGLVTQYLSMGHCRDPGSACLFVTLAGDAARRDSAVRDAFAEGLHGFSGHIEALLPHLCAERRHETALAIAATMIGAVTIARATNDDAFAASVLQAARASILQLAADQQT